MILDLSDKNVTYLREYIDLNERKECILNFIDTDQLERIVNRLEAKALVVDLPEDLYGIVDVRIELEDGTIERMPSDPFIMEAYADKHYPDLLSAQLEIMDDLALTVYSSYCGAVCSYLDSLVQTSAAQLEIIKLWTSRVKSRLMMLYRGNQTQKRDLAKTDPVIVSLQDYAAELIREKDYFESEIKHINRRIRLVGKDLDRRRSSYMREVKGNFGGTVASPRPKPNFYK